MKKLVPILLAILMLVTLASCGETVECDFCDELFKERQGSEQVYDEEIYFVCRDCAVFIQGCEDGSSVECFNCGDLIRKKDAHSFSVWGETDYSCDECYYELLDMFG